MIAVNKNAVLPIGQDSDDESIAEVFNQHDQALVAHVVSLSVTASISLQSLPPELQRAVQVLCDTYETLDLRVETTLAAAENDFITALSEVEGRETELRQLVALLVNDLRQTTSAAESSPVLLCLAFQDENDLARQLLESLETTGDKP